jgi:PiT family inorganic phosphate transporter
MRQISPAARDARCCRKCRVRGDRYTYFGIPVSTTHTITGAIVGVGAARKTAAVPWNVASDVVLTWIVTLPAAALFGAAFYELYKFLS